MMWNRFGKRAPLQARQAKFVLRLERLEDRRLLDASSLATKLDGQLIDLFAEVQPPNEDLSFEVSGPRRSSLLPDGRVRVEAVSQTTSPDLAAELTALGGDVVASYKNVIAVDIPVDLLDQVAGTSNLVFAHATMKARNRVGAVTTQGDQSLRADLARTNFGVDGTGITIGIISDSIDTVDGGLTDSQLTNDLPNNVVVLDDASFGIDEGRAMAELIHDVAPGASLVFHQAGNSRVEFASAIIDLADAGADIIVDDIFFLNQPYFSDGLVAQAVDEVVGRGVAYFSAAGNDGRSSYEEPFVDSGVEFRFPVGQVPSVVGNLHDFDPGPGVDTFQRIIIPPEGVFDPVLQWDDPFQFATGPGGAGPQSDVDFFVLEDDALDANVLLFSTDVNIVNGEAVEVPFAPLPNPSLTTPLEVHLAVVIDEGPNPGRLKYINFGDAMPDEFFTPTGTSFGHPNAAGASAVGAAAFFDTPFFGVNPPLAEDFTSAGGIEIFFDDAGNRLAQPETRQTPDIVGPDATNTTFFGSDIPQDPDAFPNFFGTSAAAPHVAAVAALMLEAAGGSGTLAPAEIYAALESTAIDMDDTFTGGFDVGFDLQTGFGFVDAVEAIDAVDVAEPTGLLGVDFGDPSSVSLLYDVDPATGAAFNARPTGVNALIDLAEDPDSGTLFAVTSVSADLGQANSLYSLDPDTGTATLIGPTGLNSIVEGDLAFDPVSGTLLGGFDQDGAGGTSLFTIDLASGSATPVGDVAPTGDPSAMAFDGAGNLLIYDVGAPATNPDSLLEVDAATGTILSTVAVTGANLGATAGMDFDPDNGQLFVADGEGSATDSLYRLNPTTGALTVVGPLAGTPEGLSGLQFLGTLLVNTPPTISEIADQAIATGEMTDVLDFTIDDAETPADQLIVTATSNNQALIPDGNIELGGSGGNRTVKATSVDGQVGVAIITVTVSDGELSVDETFVISVGLATGGVAGIKFHDFNQNGQRDAGEPGVGGVFIYADLDGNGVPGIGEPGVETAPDGTYSLLDLPLGPTRIAEVPDFGWIATTPVSVEVEIEVGQVISVDFGNVALNDFGDLPESYKTTLANNGPSHGFSPGVRLGNNVDPEGDGIPTPNADGDDVNVPGLTDDDGVLFLTGLHAGQTETLLVNASANVARLQGWIDLNGDGTFSDSEWLVRNRLLETGTNQVSFQMPSSVTSGPTFARFRLGPERDLKPYGHSLFGEVEDYRVTIPMGASDGVQVRDDQFTVDEESVDNVLAVLANDNIFGGGQFTIIGVGNPPNGTASISGDTILYTPDPNFSSPPVDVFTYTVQSDDGRTGTGTVSVTVTQLNDPPTAVDDVFPLPGEDRILPGVPVNLPVLDNDLIFPDQNETLTIIAVTDPAGGSAVIDPTGTFIVYTGDPGFEGDDTFTYTIDDGSGAPNSTDTATVTVIRTDPIVEVSMRVVSDDANRDDIVSVLSGETFIVQIYVEDLRDLQMPAPADGGVVAAYMDVEFTNSTVIVNPSLPDPNSFTTFFNNFGSVAKGTVVGNELDELGANVQIGTPAPGFDPVLMAEVRYTAGAGGTTATFAGNAPDDPANRFAVFPAMGIANVQVDFIDDSVMIVDQVISSFQNRDEPAEVNGDGAITSADVDAVLAALRSGGPRRLPRVEEETEIQYYLDVNGDRRLTLADAELVLRRLREQSGSIVNDNGELFDADEELRLAQDLVLSGSWGMRRRALASATSAPAQSPQLAALDSSLGTLAAGMDELDAGSDSLLDRLAQDFALRRATG